MADPRDAYEPELAELTEDGATDRDPRSALVGDPEATRLEHSRVQPIFLADQEAFVGNERYDVVGPLGAGGMGVVYEVYDHEREEVVALKSLPMPSASARARLKAEFRVLRELRHPRVVRLHDLVQSDDGCFFTMERVDGLPLDQALGPLPCEDGRRLREVFRQLATAVNTLHEWGVAHRDLKPSNVLVTADDEVKLLDFGLAVPLAHDDPRTRTAGTIAYMAPEQRQGEPPSPATDWFSFGGCLFHCLVGAAPFSSRGDRPPLEHRDVELVALCRELLAPRPTDRPTGAEVLTRLGASTTVPKLRFVGRTEQLALLDEVVATKGALVVVGAPGMGKTSLVQHALAQRCRLSSRCRPHEHLPFNALDGIVDALETHLVAHPTERLEQPLSALAQLFPSIPSTAHPSISPTRLRRRALDELAAQLDRVAAHRELTLFVDDLQWADAESTEALRDLLARTRRWAFVATARTDADEASLAPALPHTSTTHLGPLLHHEVSELLGDDVDAGAAGGHPLWLERMVRHPSAPPERSVEVLIGDQLDQLQDTAREVLQLLSMAGLPLTSDRLAATLGTSTAATLQAVELLLDEQLVRSEPPARRPRLEPYHDRIRELVQSAMGTAPAELHLSLARALVHEPETSATLFACADHANQALRRGLVADPIAFARINGAASRRARGATTLGTAAEYARMGMAWLEHADGRAPELKRELAMLEIEARRLAGEHAEAEAAYRRATEGLTPRERLPFARQRMQLSLLVDGAEPALACGREALASVGVHVPARGVGYADLGRVMAQTTWSLHRHGLPSHACSEAAREPMRLIAELLPVAVFLGDDTLSAWLALRCLQLTLEHGVAPESVLGITGRGGAMAILGRYTTARAAHADAQRLLERFDEEAPAMAHIATAGWLAPWAEPFGVTATTLAERESLLEQRGDAYGLSMMRTIRLTAHLEAGHSLDGLSALPESVIDLVERHDLQFEELTGFSRLSIATLQRLREGPDLPASPALHNPFATFITHLHEGLVRAFWGDVRRAALAFAAARQLVVAARGQPLLARLYCYLPIVATDVAEDPVLSLDPKLREVSSVRTCLFAAWELTRMARACPENHQPRADLAWAEVGRRLSVGAAVVTKRYERAIAGAVAQQNLELEGLARWRGLLHLRHLGRPLDPEEIERMRRAFHRWGSPARADALAAELCASKTGARQIHR